MDKKGMAQDKLRTWALRAGLAFVFLYAALSSLAHPVEWIGYLPTFLTSRFHGTILIRFFSVYELILTIWLVSGWYLRYVAILCFLTLVGIVLVNPTQLIITFRDIGLACMALALIF